jgi:hypothetical protein
LSETGNEHKEYDIVFLTAPKTKFVILGYRINTETPSNGSCDLDLQETSSIKINEVSNYIEEIYDLLLIQIPKLNPLTAEEEHVLEQRMVWILDYVRSGSTWLSRDLLKHDELIPKLTNGKLLTISRSLYIGTSTHHMRFQELSDKQWEFVSELLPPLHAQADQGLTTGLPSTAYCTSLQQAACG